MPTYALELAHGPAWDDARDIRDQDGWAAHAEFMDRLVDEGTVLLGGPVGDRQRTLHVAQAADEAALRTRLADDPWARAGRLVVGSLERWELWLDFRARSH